MQSATPQFYKGGMMKTKTRSIQQIIEDQVKSWRLQSAETKVEKAIRPVITIFRESGSGE
jgi:hypothetical protein